MKEVFILLFFSNSLMGTFAQSRNDNGNVVQDITEEMTESLTESGQSDLPEELTRLASHPVDLNGDDIEILVITGLLNPAQCTSIRQHIMEYGKLVEPEELQLVEGLDKKTIFKILPYSVVYERKEVPSSSQLTMRYQTGLMNTENNYTGSMSRMLVRFRTTMSSSLRAGLTMEKDEGEEIFTKNTPTFDFISFHIAYAGTRRLKRIIVGDYNVEFGQGLNAWSGISFSNVSAITSIYKYGRGLVPYSGTDENRFFRGIAIALEKNRLHLDCWVSYHPVDANVITDTTSGDRFVSSLQFSGYHRSSGEKTDFHSQTERAGGVHIKYKSKNFESGFISSIQNFKIPIVGNGNAYTLFNFRGTTNLNNGFYYSYTLKNILFFGEKSLSSNGTIASVNGILVSADPRFGFSILYRNYPISFHNLKSNAFGINSTNSNENGIYLAFNFAIVKQINYSAYIDAYKFPFLKYKVDAPSRGNELLHQLEYRPNKKFIAQLRYRERRKQENQSSYQTADGLLTDLTFRSFRINSNIKLDNAWTYGLRIELANTITDNQSSKGSMISQDVFYHPMGKRYSFNMRYSVFNCPDFESRIYAYENDVQGAFSVPFYYGNGSRFYVNLNLHIGRKINLSLRYSKTWQEDEVNYKERNDIKVQMRAVF